MGSNYTMLTCRLYEKHGEAAVRSFSQFYPTITPADVMAMAQQSHFLAYLDNLVQSRTEGHRYIFSLIFLSKEKKKRHWSHFLAESYIHFFLQVAVSAVPSRTRITATGLAWARTYPWCSSALWYLNPWRTAQVCYCCVRKKLQNNFFFVLTKKHICWTDGN